MKKLLCLLITCSFVSAQTPAPFTFEDAGWLGSLKPATSTSLSPPSANLVAWFKVDSGVQDGNGSLPSDGSEVRKWVSNNASGAYELGCAAGTGPYYRATGGPNGLAAVNTEQSHRLMTSYGSKGWSAVSQPYTIYILYKDGPNGGRMILDGCDSSHYCRVDMYASAPGVYTGGWLNWSGYYSHTNWTVFTIRPNGTSSFIRTNGAYLPKSGTGGNHQCNNWGLGVDVIDGEPAGTGFSGYFVELLLYNSSHTTNDMLDVEAYLKQRAGL